MTLTRHGVRGLSIFGDSVERRTGVALPWEELCVCAASPRQYISIVPTTTGLAATHAGQCAAVSRGVPQHCSRRTPSIRGLPPRPGQAASRVAGSRPVLCRRRKRAIPLQRQNAAWFMRQQPAPARSTVLAARELLSGGGQPVRRTAPSAGFCMSHRHVVDLRDMARAAGMLMRGRGSDGVIGLVNSPAMATHRRIS